MTISWDSLVIDNSVNTLSIVSHAALLGEVIVGIALFRFMFADLATNFFCTFACRSWHAGHHSFKT